ncbi:MAG: protein kinase domain-containing protein [Polyangiaceae bacterium]
MSVLVSPGIDVGHVVAGKFELVRLLGRGSMGEVWVAHHRTLGEHVALKLLTSSLDGEVVEDSAQAAARFRFEAQIAARLSRKTRHIVRVTDHGEENGLAYLVMELLEGHTLDSMLEKGRLPVDVVADIVTQIARALTHAHAEGVFHRDLKPANVFVSHDEEGRRLVKVLDFGIARAIHAHRVRGPFATARGIVFGTPGYMSPEQAFASEKLDHRCDVWALSVMAYEALSGTLPMEGADVQELLRNLCAGRLVPLSERIPDVPPQLSEFFARAFAERIENRYASASELAQDFAKAADVGASPDASGSSPAVSNAFDEMEPAPPEVSDAKTNALRPRRRGKVRAVSLALVGAALGLVALGVVWHALSHPAGAEAVAPSAPSAMASAPSVTPVAPPAQPQVADEEQPSLAVSSLPRAPGHPISAARGPVVPVVPSQPPTLAPATPTPAPAPSPAPPRSPAKPRDKSDVL